MTPMFSMEAEHGVLGACLRDPAMIEVITDDLPPEAFSDIDNRAMYAMIRKMHGAGEATDPISLAERLPELPSGEFTHRYASELMRNTPSTANAMTYAKIVRERASIRAVAACAERMHEIASSDMAPAEMVAEAQRAASELDAGGDDDGVQDIGAVMERCAEEWERRWNNHHEGVSLLGMSTGLKDLDDLTMGLQGNNLIVIAGRPGMGKTTLAMGFANEAAIKQGKSVLVFSLEMPAAQLTDRFTSALSRVPLAEIKRGTFLDNSDYCTDVTAAAGSIRKAKLAICYKPGATMGRIRSICRRHRARAGLDMVVIDYLQLLSTESKSLNRVDVVSEMSRQGKLLAGELGVPVILLSQLSRECEKRPDKRPIPSDLRESGAIEQDADIIMLVYRDEVYNQDTDRKGVAEIIVAKSRDGEPGTVHCAFLGHINKFENLSHGALAEIVERENLKAEKKASKKSARDFL